MPVVPDMRVPSNLPAAGPVTAANTRIGRRIVCGGRHTQQHGSGFGIDQRLDLFHHQPQQLIQIERGGQNPARCIERRQLAGAAFEIVIELRDLLLGPHALNEIAQQGAVDRRSFPG